MLAQLFTLNSLMSFLTLCVLEIVLGIDNIIFLSIISGRVPPERRHFARFIGLSLALLLRIVMLSGIAWLAHLNQKVFTAFGEDISWRDIVLGIGGLFLMYKATVEIHSEIEDAHEDAKDKPYQGMASAITQIVIVDLLLSFDSIFTAVGVAEFLPVMIGAIFVAILIMLFASAAVSNFVNAHPTVKMLALTFILLVGVVLIADAAHFHMPRGYLYFAICFSLGVEFLNQLVASKRRKHGGHGGLPLV